MKLDINTDLLRSSVATAKIANDALTEAADILNRIIVHDDWGCPERTQINNNTLENKALVNSIQSKSSSFYHAIENSSQRFDEIETSNVQRTSSIDDVVGRILNVVPGITGAASVGSNIAITSFSDIASSLGKSEE